MKLPLPDIDNRYIVFAMFFMLSNRLQKIGDSFFNEVSTKQWFILLVLNGIMKDYEPTLNELSEVVGSSHQNVKQLVLKLEQKGYVELHKDKEDARRLRIKTTQKVHEFHNDYEIKSFEFMEKLFSKCKEEDLTTTLNTMLSLNNNLERLEKDYVRE